LSVPAALLALGTAACGGGAPAARPTPSAPPSLAGDAPDARSDLAGRAALAQDHGFAALYTLDGGDGVTHNVVATVGADGTWRVDVAGGALGGTADVSIASTKTGVYQCTMSTPEHPITPTCIGVAKPGRAVPSAYDPPVERLFRRWLSVFTDRQAALSVAEVEPLAGAQGTCFSIDSISASLKAPVDIGIYCYADDGLLTAARVDFGVLKLVNEVAGPATVALPGPDVAGEPMGMDRPATTAPVDPPASTSPASTSPGASSPPGA
jgi:hypothetical protein